MDDFFSAQGRIGRRTFFARRMGILIGYFAACFAVSFTVSFLDSSARSDTAGIVAVGLLIPFAIADLLQAIKRCHDINYTGWYVLLTCVPLVGIIAAIPLLLVKGTSGPNRFGGDPLGYVSLTNSYAS